MSNDEFPSWKAEDPAGSLTRIYKWAIDKAQEQIAWYEVKKRPKRTGSQWLRAVAIVSAAIGALFPLIDAAMADSQTFLAQSGQWGYVAIALAAAVVGYDKFFGLSSGWMRYTITQLSLDKALKEFQYDWIILNIQQVQQPPNGNIATLLQRLKEFSLQMDALVRQETDTWVTEFQANISQLDRMLQTETQTRAPGSIKAIVANARDFDKVTLLLDGFSSMDLTDGTESVFASISPGPHQITAIGEKDNEQHRDSKVVDVQADTMTSIEFALPAA